MARLSFLGISIDLEVWAEITNVALDLAKRYLRKTNEDANDYLQREDQVAHAGSDDVAVQAGLRRCWH